MKQKNLRNRILDASDDDPDIHAAYKTGQTNQIEYYLVIAEKEHEGKEMLKIRYFAAHLNAPAEDTWMKNGVTARQGPQLIDKFATDFPAIVQGVTGSEGEFFVKDVTGDE